MRALIQRTIRASVSVGAETIADTGPGLLILVCAMAGDTDADARTLATRITKLRIFRDENGKMNRSILDTGGAALVVSQFTLAADTSRGNRPGFSQAAPPDEGRRLYKLFAKELAALNIPVQTGRFAADMAVTLTNDGPVTIWMDTGVSPQS